MVRMYSNNMEAVFNFINVMKPIMEHYMCSTGTYMILRMYAVHEWNMCYGYLLKKHRLI